MGNQPKFALGRVVNTVLLGGQSRMFEEHEARHTIQYSDD